MTICQAESLTLFAKQVVVDPSLTSKQRAFIADAARALDKAKMIRFDEKSGNFYGTELGRIASHFYIKYTSVETYNEMLKQHMNESEVCTFVFKLGTHLIFIVIVFSTGNMFFYNLCSL